MWLLLGLAVEAGASSLEHVSLSRRRSEEMADLAADGLRATLYCTLAPGHPCRLPIET